MKRPRIKKQKLLIFTTSKDKEMQDLAEFNTKKIAKEKKKRYVGFIFGKEKTITREEYEDMLSLGMKVKQIYQ